MQWFPLWLPGFPLELQGCSLRRMPALCRTALHCLEAPQPPASPRGSKAAWRTPAHAGPPFGLVYKLLALVTAEKDASHTPLPAPPRAATERPATSLRPPLCHTFVTAASVAPPPPRAAAIVAERVLSSPISRSRVIFGVNARAAGPRLESAAAKSQAAPVPAPPAEPEASPFCFGWWRLWCFGAGGFSAGLALRGLAARTVGAPASCLRLAASPGDVRRARRVSTDCRRSRPAAPNVVVRRGNGARAPRRRWRWRRE